MRINTCSVAFRHLDVTARDLARYVAREGFDGLEIWAPHARALAAEWQTLPQRPPVPMLAGYLPLGTPDFNRADANALLDLTGVWDAPRLRLFAGGLGSDRADADQRRAVQRDLATVADMARDRGLRIAVETHPDTLADSLGATLSLLDALDHPAVGVNFDVLHVWESGTDPMAALSALRSHVDHLHLKSVTGRDRLSVFHPANVHDPQGSRDGMCPLLSGAIDYAALLPCLPADIGASLEWFGPKPAATMAGDLRALRRDMLDRVA
ncbi:sugar phosphate isomerase/epimerase family protein [Paracoccus sp. Ld10]|uniref:sugar phosphate isomerase/epimerase family protein n=1 Tax=Paracoccus sp. Ld10 TaxID=649158 RepID=UPI003868F55B